MSVQTARHGPEFYLRKLGKELRRFKRLEPA